MDLVMGLVMTCRCRAPSSHPRGPSPEVQRSGQKADPRRGDTVGCTLLRGSSSLWDSGACAVPLEAGTNMGRASVCSPSDWSKAASIALGLEDLDADIASIEVHACFFDVRTRSVLTRQTNGRRASTLQLGITSASM